MGFLQKLFTGQGTPTEKLQNAIKTSRTPADLQAYYQELPMRERCCIHAGSAIKSAIEMDRPDIFEAVVNLVGEENFSQLVYTHAYGPMGSACTGKYDLLGYALYKGAKETALLLANRNDVFPSKGHLNFASQQGYGEVAGVIGGRLGYKSSLPSTSPS